MHWSIKVSACALSMLLLSCQTAQQAYPPTTTETENVVTTDAVCGWTKPILLSRADILSKPTEEAVGDHNNAYWCACEAARPPGFDAAICPKGN